MKDIQSQVDHRRINIKKVGVKDITYPVMLLDKANKLQRTVANFNMYVNLPHRFKGTHMSRFVEILNQYHGEIDIKNLRLILEEMKDRLDAQAAHMEIEFPYFLKHKTGHANAIGLGEYRCRMHAVLDEEYKLVMEISVPIAPSLAAQNNTGLPRSPGHWGNAIISVQYRHFIWIEDIIKMVDDVIGQKHLLGDGTLQPRLKNNDVPVGQKLLSVEKIVKELGSKFSSNKNIHHFSITVENLAEGYKTFATLEWPENGN
jgi:GTP cyclohydrolase I